MPAIPPDLNNRLIQTLTRCGPFDSNTALYTSFTDARIAAWRDRIPDSAHNRGERITALVDALHDQYNTQGENALVLFLHALCEQIPPADSCQQELATLADELEHTKQPIVSLRHLVPPILDTYLSSLVDELSLWRGLGLHRDVYLDDIYVSANVEKDNAQRGQVISETKLLQYLLKGQIQSQKLLLEGEAGSGKTTLLRRWALNLAQLAKKSLSEHIPIFLPLSFVELSCSTAMNWNFSLIDLVTKRFPNPGGQSSLALHQAITEVLKSNRAIILLDAVDEISEQRHSEMHNWINTVCRAIGKNFIVLTSRPIYFVNSFSGFHKYKVCPFNSNQKEYFITSWFESIHQPEQAELMNQYLEHPDMFLVNDSSVAGNPLFLTIMCIEFELTKKLSRTPGRLMDQFTKILLEDWDLERGIPRIYGRKLDLKRRVLESVASYFFETGRVTFSLGELLDCVRDVLTTYGYTNHPEELVREIESRSGLIVEDRYGDWQFSHLLFQEFFTARFQWRNRQDELKHKTWLQKAAFDERYKRIMDFYNQLG